MDKKSEEYLTKYFEEKLKEQYKNGLSVGVKTVSKVVLDILNNSSLSMANRISEVKRFCKSPFVTNKKSTETDKGQSNDGIIKMSDVKTDATVAKAEGRDADNPKT